MSKSVKVFHPILFAIFPVVFLYSHNAGEVFLPQTLIAFSTCLAGGTLLWSFFGLLCRNMDKSALMTSISIAFFFFYGHLFSLIDGFSIGNWRPGIHTYFLPLWASALFALLVVVFRGKKPLIKLTKISNAIAVCMIALPLVNIGMIEIQGLPRTKLGNESSVSSDDESESIQAGEIIAKPDIYYIILDAHIRADIAQKYFDYDNSLFVSKLKENGFFVAEKSCSNYTRTIMSIPSSLNSQYLDEVSDASSAGAKRQKYTLKKAASNRLFKFLREQGYLQVVFAARAFPDFIGTDITLTSEYTINAFTDELLNSTPFIAFKKMFYTRHYKHYREAKHVLENLAGTAKLDSPHIVFAHILSPHPPFVFDEDGNYNLSEGSFLWGCDNPNRTGSMSGYFDQLKYIDKKIVEVVESILANSKEEPIIIIQGDHGIICPPGYSIPEINYAILNALHLPGFDYSKLDHNLTPVNTFRYILNHYFGTELEILENRIFILNDEVGRLEAPDN